MTSTKTASVFGHNPKFAYNFYLTEIAKYERGEPAAVQRKDNVLYVQLPTNGKLLPDREQLETFIRTMFKHATPGNWVSLRAFPDKGNRNEKPFKITPVKLNGGFDELIDKACREAELAANFRDKIVLSPPIATFSNKDHAREQDLTEGFTVSTECDANPQAARAKLEELLGPATVVVESGGEWINPETGEVEPKLHIHYRLKVPARDKAALAKLKIARTMATAIVGGDTTNNTIVHPIRWAGSWHRKKEPKLTRVVAVSENEVDLDKALEILKAAAPQVDYGEHEANDNLQVDPDLIYEAMTLVPNNGVLPGNVEEWNAWNTVGGTIHAATGGDPRGCEAFHMWSAKSPKYNEADTDTRWQHFFSHPFNKKGAGSIIYWANEVDPDWQSKYWDRVIADAYGLCDQQEETAQVKPAQSETKSAAEPKQYEQKVVDLWEEQKPPPLPEGVLPKKIEDFVLRQAELMGCDPAGLAMGALTTCGAAISDLIKIQPKEHEPEWKQSARLWTGLCGPVSAIKSAQMDRATEHFLGIDHLMRDQYQTDMEAYEALTDEEKKTTPKPKQKRLCIEDTTPEALQSIMQDNPHGQFMIRDELSGFFGGMDKYANNRGGSYDRGFWLKAYNGGQYSFDRVKRGSGLIENCGVSILGGIQDDTLRTFVNEGIDDGLIQRMLLIMLRAAVVGKNVSLPPHQYNQLIDQLRMLAPRADDRVTYRFDDEAEAIRYELEKKHIDLAATAGRLNKKLSAHIMKYNGIFARLCLIWHCIKIVDEDNSGWASYDQMFIDGDTAQQVAKFLHKFLLPHACSFYIGVLGLSDQHDVLADTAGYILAHELKKLTPRDIQRGSRKMRELEKSDTNRIFEQLDAYGWLNCVRGKSYSDVTWWVNPAVHEIFATKAEEERERRQGNGLRLSP